MQLISSIEEFFLLLWARNSLGTEHKLCMKRTSKSTAKNVIIELRLDVIFYGSLGLIKFSRFRQVRHTETDGRNQCFSSAFSAEAERTLLGFIIEWSERASQNASHSFPPGELIIFVYKTQQSIPLTALSLFPTICLATNAAILLRFLWWYETWTYFQLRGKKSGNLMSWNLQCVRRRKKINSQKSSPFGNVIYSRSGVMTNTIHQHDITQVRQSSSIWKLLRSLLARTKERTRKVLSTFGYFYWPWTSKGSDRPRFQLFGCCFKQMICWL